MDDTSILNLRPRMNPDGTYSCERRRTVEISAGRVRRSVITEVMKQAVRLDRIASAPHAFPNEKAAPRKSLSGAAKLNWIACRMSVTPKDVAIILERASLLLREEVLDVI